MRISNVLKASLAISALALVNAPHAAVAQAADKPLLMIQPDKTFTVVKRGEQVPVTYKVQNLGTAPALDGAIVGVRIPEGFTCGRMQLSGDAELVECIDGLKAGGPRGRLLTGDYALLKMKGAIPAAVDANTPGEKTFKLTWKYPADFADNTDARFEVGVVAYQQAPTPGQAGPSTYYPSFNTGCINQGNTGGTPNALWDKQCTLQLSNAVMNTPITEADLGKRAFIVPEKSGKKKAMQLIYLVLNSPSGDLTGTSSDLTQDPDPDLTVVPGEMGSVNLVVKPNPKHPASTEPEPTKLRGVKIPGNTTLEIVVSGVDASNADDENARHFAKTDEIKAAVRAAFGTHVDPNKVTVTGNPAGEGSYAITIPLESYPANPVTLNLPDLFRVSDKAPKVEAKLRGKKLVLLHRDMINGYPAIDQQPLAGAQEIKLDRGPVNYVLKKPALMVTKTVKSPTTGQLTANTPVTYEVKVANTSEVTAYDVKLTDTLADGFTHQAAITSIDVQPTSLDPFKTQTAWTLADAGRTGSWPADVVHIPAGGTITLTYTANGPASVTTGTQYANVVRATFKSLPTTPVPTPGAVSETVEANAGISGYNPPPPYNPPANPPAPPAPSPSPSPSIAVDRPDDIPPAPQPPATPAPVTPGFTPSQKDPEERAEGWVDAVIPAGQQAKVVLIGRDNIFADSLSSGGLQGLLDAPLLLNPVEKLSDRTKKNLDRLKPEQVIILGGPKAQSQAVEDELKKLGWNVSRVQGPTRVETAVDAAQVHAPNATEGVLARAYAAEGGSGTQAFADALGGGAFAARKQRPVFLTQSNTLTPTLQEYLAKSKIKHLTLMGSTEAISTKVEQQLNGLGIQTTRISGTNRAQTAVLTANALGYWNASEAESVLVVNGESDDAWTDAFPAAFYAKRYELPVVLSGKDALLPETATWLTPGASRKPATRVICGYSVGAVKECAFTPAKAGTNEND